MGKVVSVLLSLFVISLFITVGSGEPVAAQQDTLDSLALAPIVPSPDATANVTELPPAMLPITSFACHSVVASSGEPNPADSFLSPADDDGPFDWMWEETTTSRSIYEHQNQVARSAAKSKKSSWLDIFPRKQEAPKSPEVSLSQLSPFAGKRSKTHEESSMWGSTKQRWHGFQAKVKETSQRNWTWWKEKLGQ